MIRLCEEHDWSLRDSFEDVLELQASYASQLMSLPDRFDDQA